MVAQLQVILDFSDMASIKAFYFSIEYTNDCDSLKSS